MDIQQALEIVSYKLGAKKGTAALEESLLLPEIVAQAIADQAQGSLRQIDAKSYMTATKLVKQERLQRDKAAGDAFLAANAQQPGVQTTASGVQYLVLAEGSGPHPTIHDSVRVNYEGRLIDGTVFDSSAARGSAATFAVGKVIAGWREGIQLMSPGARYRLFIPEHLAYGDRGAEGFVPPFAALVFEVELLAIC